MYKSRVLKRTNFYQHWQSVCCMKKIRCPTKAEMYPPLKQMMCVSGDNNASALSMLQKCIANLRKISNVAFCDPSIWMWFEGKTIYSHQTHIIIEAWLMDEVWPFWPILWTRYQRTKARFFKHLTLVVNSCGSIRDCHRPHLMLNSCISNRARHDASDARCGR